MSQLRRRKLETMLEAVSDRKRPSEKLSLFTSLGLLIVAVQIGCEVTKQISNYSLQYRNGGKFPIPKTALVVLVEAVKLLVTLVRAHGSCPATNLSSWRQSPRFLLPGIIYGINNNIYLYALTLVSPPIWNILISVRTVITACVYKCVLGRSVTKWQFFGVTLIVASLSITKLPELLEMAGYAGLDRSIARAVVKLVKQESGGNVTAPVDGSDRFVNALPLGAALIALVAAANSVGAAVYTEKLFKGPPVRGETFLDQQFWLYFYGIVVAAALHFASAPGYGIVSLASDLSGMPAHLNAILAVAVFFASVGGIVVASILKLLDNVVKEYSAYSANIITAAFCAYLFPDKFQLNLHMAMSMSCLMLGIYLYEAKRVKPVFGGGGGGKET